MTRRKTSTQLLELAETFLWLAAVASIATIILAWAIIEVRY